MLRKILFKTEAGEEVTLPVTPKSYFVRRGMTVQTVDVYQVGSYSVPTTEAHESISLPCMFPSGNRPYCVKYTEQSALMDWIKRQIATKAKMRFIVSDTGVNLPVYITAIEYGEQDGTNDIYATLTLQPYITLAAPAVQTSTRPTPTREATPQQTSMTTYTVKTGDNLWNICKRFYGDGSLCYKLAAYNSIKNANLIYTGQVLKIPDAATLGATAATQTASSGTVSGSSSKTQSSLTMTITMSGTFTGYASYSVIDAKTNKTTSAEVGRGVTLNVAKGSSVTVRWRSGVGCYCDKITLNGRPQTVSGESYRLSVFTNYTLDLHWTR